LALSPKKA